MKDAMRKTLAFLVLAVIAAVIFTVTSVAGRASAETVYTGSAECMIVL